MNAETTSGQAVMQVLGRLSCTCVIGQGLQSRRDWASFANQMFIPLPASPCQPLPFSVRSAAFQDRTLHSPQGSGLLMW